ncbi:HPr family phosphocarrier protein [bacterium]|nr:HPr family phosphocarrier protein [bacterium]
MEKQFVIKSENGLHARPAGVLAKRAADFKSSIEIQTSKGSANAKSIMSVMALGIVSGATIKIVTEGEDEREALEALEELLTSNVSE